jgi:peptidoglycan hydrolase-like protein with peptidoglycan-binding domain
MGYGRWARNGVRAALALLLLVGATSGIAAPRKPAPARSARQKTTTTKKKVVKKRTPPVQMAPTRDRIIEIQQALASAGTYQGEPTGKWDAASIEAMTRFQSSHGLSATGKIDALTLEKLGLGSGTAGRGAPVARAPATAAPPAPATGDSAATP